MTGQIETASQNFASLLQRFNMPAQKLETAKSVDKKICEQSKFGFEYGSLVTNANGTSQNSSAFPPAAESDRTSKYNYEMPKMHRGVSSSIDKLVVKSLESSQSGLGVVVQDSQKAKTAPTPKRKASPFARIISALYSDHHTALPASAVTEPSRAVDQPRSAIIWAAKTLFESPKPTPMESSTPLRVKPRRLNSDKFTAFEAQGQKRIASPCLKVTSITASKATLEPVEIIEKTQAQLRAPSSPLRRSATPSLPAARPLTPLDMGDFGDAKSAPKDVGVLDFDLGHKFALGAFDRFELPDFKASKKVNETVLDVSSVKTAEPQEKGPSIEPSAFKAARLRFESPHHTSPTLAPQTTKRAFFKPQTQYPSCRNCEKIVYPLELVIMATQSFHRSCFKCVDCNSVLRMNNASLLGERWFCKTHYLSRFREKGRYEY